MCDFNSRCSGEEDYVVGVDELQDREVLNFHKNKCGELFCDFLRNVNYCMLNGRNNIHNYSEFYYQRVITRSYK